MRRNLRHALQHSLAKRGHCVLHPHRVAAPFSLVGLADKLEAKFGRFGPKKDHLWIYDHALATMAVGEILVLSGDTLGLGRTVEAAAELCLEARNEGQGWRYGLAA